MGTSISSHIFSAAAILCALIVPSGSAETATKPAVPAVPAEQSGRRKPADGLIDSDLNGVEMTFLSNAIDLGQTFRFLVSQVPRTGNPAMQSFGEDLAKTLAAQNAVLKTVAELRKIKVPDEEDAPMHRLAETFGKMEGVKLQKALLDAFRDADRQAITTYELGAKSEDATIRNLSMQTFPKFREHLILVETMLGIRSAGHPASGPEVRKSADTER